MPFNCKLFRKERSSGFTLLELLVVIAIIGLFSSIVMVSLGSVRRDSRNTYRNQSMEEYIKAANLYYATYGEYPPTSTSSEPLYCLAKDTPNCYFFGGNKPTDNTLNNAFSEYIKVSGPFPLIDNASFASIPIEGPFYQCSFVNGLCMGVFFLWYLDGDKNCGNGAQGVYSEFFNVTTCPLTLE